MEVKDKPKNAIIPVEKEIKIVAMIARGDTQTQIAEVMEVHPVTVANIKKRNAEVLKMIQSKMIAHQAKLASQNLEKANELIKKRLHNAEHFDQEMAKIELEYESSEKTKEDDANYRAKMANLRRSLDITLTELTGVSREMHSQAKADIASDIPKDPEQAKAHLAALVEAINNGDEVVLQQITLNPKEN